MNKTSLLFTLTASLPLLAAEPDLSKLPPPSDKPGLTYAQDIRPLFEASCFNCHGERRQRAGLRLDSLEAVLQGGDEGKVIVTGKSKESSLVVAIAQLDDESAMPPTRGRGGPGGPGGGLGGAAGARGTNGPGRAGGGFSPANRIAPQMFAQADKDADKKVSQAEFMALADTWFDKLDANKAGKLSQEQFTEKFDNLLPQAPAAGAPGGGGGGRGPGGQRGGEEAFGGGGGLLGRMVGPGFFTASDTDTNGALTRAELKVTFTKWFASWDTNKSGALNEAGLLAGLNASLPRQNFGGGGRGAGGPGGMAGFMGGRRALAQQMISEADKNKDEKLTKAEFTALADAWWDKLGPAKTGQLTQEQFSSKLAEVLAPSQGAPGTNTAVAGTNPGQPGGGRGPGGPGGGTSFGPAFFTATDANKDNAVTLAEFKAAFEKWFTEWDTTKQAALNDETLYAGLSALLPQRGFGGGGAPGGFGGNTGPAPQPLTAAQVGLVRAWIDQGAK